MSDAPRRKGRPYDVGYAKPPNHSRFAKGQSGNPSGRSRRGLTALGDLLQKELKRKLPARERERVVYLRAEQALARNLVASAAKGQVPALRALLQVLETGTSTPDLREREEGPAKAARRKELMEQWRKSIEELRERERRAETTLQRARELGINLD